MRKIVTFIALILMIASVNAQETDTVRTTKKGWKFGGALPAIAYDSDLGFRYGALANFYDYGDGTIYPNYLRNIYVEWSRTTKGSGINRFTYDDKAFLGSDIRLTFDVNYQIEQSLDFYGFNGYQAEYNHAFEDPESDLYKSKMYYRHDRRMFFVLSHFQQYIDEAQTIKWFAALDYFNIKINSVDIDRLNKGKDADQLLPSVDSVPGIYEQYVSYGIIPADQRNGGNIIQLKAGAVYDTRDNEANPMHGIWTEAFFTYVPAIFGNNYSYSLINLTHRQYFTIIPNRWSFVYRVIYQQKLSGTIPFYMLPFYYSTKENRDGFGGAKTLRGILRNRVVGDAVFATNLETRYKVLMTKIGSQDFYIALSAFTDLGRVTQRYEFTQNPGTPDVWVGEEGWHIGVGGGIRFALNENFIVAVDYGKALDPRDGNSGLYIGLNWLF